MTQTAPDREKFHLNGSNAAQPAESEQEAASVSITVTDKPRPNLLSGGRGLFFGIGIGMVLALGSNHLLSSRQANPPAKTPPPTTSTAPAQSVTVAEVGTQGVNRTLKAKGSVAAFEMIPVMSQATGLQIQQVLVEEGTFVKAGQVMVTLDNAVLQAQLTQAKAAVDQAEARLAELRAGTRSEEIAQARETVKSAQAAVEQAQSDLDLANKRVARNQMLQAEGAIARDRLDEVINQERSSRSTLERARASFREAQQRLEQLETGPRPETISQAAAQLAQAKAQMQSVTAQLNDTRVLAPASGKVAERNARVGDITSSSQKLFTIIENGRLELLLPVPETELKQIRPGQTVQITSDADSNLRLSGKVREIDPMVEEKSRQAKVKVDLPAVASLKPGMFLKATITTATATGLTVPAKALLPQADGSTIVYILQPDNSVKAQPVEVGEPTSGDRQEIKKGLSPGDRVIVKGAPYLKEGDRVQVISY
ncbi:MAG TPA: efflux transporter periplasmic adaptor subunit [Cyanobacteria bacterium UBA8803]|nr:efflux transporter periplasmic adaptor subunit [Cyanobacteria bacterium UBA8803]